MKIRLDSVRGEPWRWQETVPVGAAAVGLGPGSELSPVEVEGSLSRAGSELLLEATLRFHLTVPCDRCMAVVRAEVEAPWMLVVTPEGAPPREDGEIELHEDDFGRLEVSGPELDTEPLVVEQVELALPVHPLCRPDCAGLCPVCGGDRNVTKCGCRTEELDPRWVGLAEMRKKLDERG